MISSHVTFFNWKLKFSYSFTLLGLYYISLKGLGFIASSQNFCVQIYYLCQASLPLPPNNSTFTDSMLARLANDLIILSFESYSGNGTFQTKYTDISTKTSHNVQFIETVDSKQEELDYSFLHQIFNLKRFSFQL